ncbi:PREDICTED: uncharacterized protein LOC109332907 [Lupinus angustifolius]|uniref:uncharacterized protein LOC109332907 n=1 Tax=Lupinus angustifolius TaxID=3871 RepID=UPI00092F3111|nr:PREDICTED: uncharacterized protein LOC109332907 [Lupinus angustifolius]XP_019423598.1 PREDICTED: uncharacterized protein LOC109332907 [Lupinus angustifolius]
MEEMKSVNDSTQLADVKNLQDDVTSDNAVLEDEKKTISKLESENALKVDEFGRYLKEGPADSESDDSRYRRTGRLNRRDRSHSRSRSPPQRRSRRRRSPRGIRGRRSRSRSRSPRRRRSRSKSPIIRRSGEFGNVKRDKSQCFDFSRGRCYRGASCRYIHHESNRNATSRRFKNNNDLEVDSHENNSGVNEGLKNIASNISDYEHGGVRSQDVDLFQNVNGHEVEPRKEDSVRHAVVCSTSGFGSHLVSNDPNNFERFRKVAPEVQETLVVREEHKTLANNNDSSQNALNSHQPHMSMSNVSDSSFDKKSTISATANMVSNSDPIPYVLPSTQQQSAPSSVGICLSSEQPPLHFEAHQEMRPHSSSSVEVPLHTYQLPPPPPPPVASHSQGENNVNVPQIPMEYGVTQQSAFFPFQFTTRGQFEHYPAPFHTQNFQFNLPPNRTSLPLPPPPPLPPPLAVKSSGFSSGVAEPYISEEFNQRQLHSTNFASQTSMAHAMPSHSQSSESFDQAHTLMQDRSRTFMLKDASSPKHLPQGNSASQSLSGSNLHRDDRHKQLSMQDSSSQQQQSIYNFPYSASEIKLGVPGENLTVSRFPSGVLDKNHSTSLPAFGGSQISAHYNPYASTFEQPLSSKFSSSIFRHENDIIHNNNYGSSVLNHAPITREGVGTGGGSRQSASSPKSARADGQMLPRSDGNLYDPLFDCIEPSSPSLKKFNFDKNQEVIGESNISPRPKSSSMSLDTEEKNKHEDVASSTSQSNDEYGDTTDAEVGAVENESLSNHVDVAKMTTGGVEINQVKSPGKRKKSKDSRSMKLFKISIANFVKEVLKPSWQQGNMSKVAFKTIVKKTVDKVSGAMKDHHVPNSQVKISQYIDSSQQKLTKLVMGYVDKYVKM